MIFRQLEQQVGVTVWLSGSGVVHVTITDSIDSVDLIGSPAAVVAVCCRIINATEDALAKARVEGPAT